MGLKKLSGLRYVGLKYEKSEPGGAGALNPAQSVNSNS
jgi:hypothetical protein